MPSPDYKSKNSCIMHPKEDYWVRLYSSYLNICDGSRAGAFLLHWLEYATNRLPEDSAGWVTVTCRELAENSFGLASAPEICRQISALVERGLIEKQDGGPRQSASYRLAIDHLQRAVFSVSPRNAAFHHETLSVSPRNITGDSDSSLYIERKEKGNTPLPPSSDSEHPAPLFPTDRPIDKWVEEEARARGLVVRINSAAKRQVLNAVDSPEFRENIWGKLVDLTEEVPGENVTDRIMALAGRETGAPKPQRSFSAPIGHRSPQTRPQGDSGGRNTYSERKPPTKFAERLLKILVPYTIEPVLPADWICHDLEALSLRLKTFDADLIRFAQGHSGASLAAVLMAFRTAYASPKDIKRRESEDAMERAKAKLRAERTAEAAKKGVKL